MFEATKKFCDSLLSYGLPGFDVIVYHQGNCVLRYRNGYRDLENKVEMTGTERLNPVHMTTCFLKESHGYGLGVRCGNGDPRNSDFGWDGAACSYMALDTENAISIFLGAHQFASPVQNVRNLLYRFVRAELVDSTDLPCLLEEASAKLARL